jgi:hypothetical protein
MALSVTLVIANLPRQLYPLTHRYRCLFMIVLMTGVVYHVGLSIVRVWHHHSCLAIHPGVALAI